MSFLIAPAVHYLNCACMSPLPHSVEEARRAGMARKQRPWTIRPTDFFTEVDEVKAAFADVLGTPRREQVAVLPSVSYGMAIVARNVPFRPGQHIVVAGEQFPSNVHPWRRLAEQRGGDVRAVAPPDQRNGRAAAWNAALHDAIDERTAMLAIGHVHWADGTRFDLPRLAARAREVAAWVVIDGTQGVGALDFPFDDVRPDAVMCAAYKWLMGPYGVAIGWFGDVLQDGEPIEETWSGRRGSEDFRGLADYTDVYGPGSVRFDVGQRSNFIMLPMTIEALRLVKGWGTARIQAHCASLWGPVLEGLVEAGYAIEDAAWRGRHLVGVRPPASADSSVLAARLAAANVHVSWRGTSIRVSPHLYNTPEDMQALSAALTGHT
ncbi:putative cysteine desulfurase [Luteitalea pratensis]|uniref:Putative cysteine desulfurase n=1 Tax=Luteitalea pratensis TaxID=1855912 RepID=A0A143PTU6_LUTPR|nr:aminotransferase class V-fold PLP-dependent enzyme [Luteitalea pratensis]AMY11239.1 putative cysteine desulfurase [Luteitalea pratensis]